MTECAECGAPIHRSETGAWVHGFYGAGHAATPAPTCDCPVDAGLGAVLHRQGCKRAEWFNWTAVARFTRRLSRSWIPGDMTPACDWCGTCDWCQSL